jgi:hypothetical protein
MLHVKELASGCDPKAWPIVMEAIYPNFFIGFLTRWNMDVSALLADENYQNPFLYWYGWKKMVEWRRYQSLERLVSEFAPIPYTNWSFRKETPVLRDSGHTTSCTSSCGKVPHPRNK